MDLTNKKKMTIKEKYRHFCATEETIPLFSKPWWLDLTAGTENWDVSLVIENDQILASMPYVVRKKFGQLFLEQPKSTQFLGPWVQKSANEKDLLIKIAELLPTFDQYSQSWHPKHQNWLPFYWQGYKQTTKYTYRLNYLQDLDGVYQNFQSNIKSDIKKAMNKNGVRVESGTIDELIVLNNKTFARQNLSSPYTDDFLRALDDACKKNNCRKIFIAKDQNGRAHAGAYVVWDKNSAYYLIGGGDPELRNSGATSLCIWESIKFAASVTESFDFEGSMIKPIEKFFRAFGGTQTPYFHISKTNSRLLKLNNFLNSLKSL